MERDLLDIYTSDVVLENSGLTKNDFKEASEYRDYYNKLHLRHKENIAKYEKEKRRYYNELSNDLNSIYPLAIMGIVLCYFLFHTCLSWSIVGSAVCAIIFGSISGIYLGIFTILPLYISNLLIKIFAKILTLLRYGNKPYYLEWTPPTPPKKYDSVVNYISKMRNKGIDIDIDAVYRTEHNQYETFVHSFTHECRVHSEDIVGKVIKRAIKRFNDALRFGVSWDDCPESFNAFDIYCARWYKEDVPHAEHIRDRIEDFLELEYDALPKAEQILLDYAFHTNDYQTDWNNVLNQLYDAFMVEVNNHCQTKKIQAFLENI